MKISRLLTSFTTMLVRVVTLFILLQVAFTSVELNTHNDKSRDFEVLGDKRYYFHLSPVLHMEEAWNVCRDVNASLLALETANESQLVTAYIRDVLKLEERYYWTSGIKTSDGWTWASTGRALNYDNWATDNPTESSPWKQACIHLHNGKLYDNKCDVDNFYVVCEASC